MSGADHGGRRAGARTVFFVSDYGSRDEFVGVVHAVIRRLAPEVRVIDLSHEVPPFAVRSGAELLVRAAPHLGEGAVLGVVDPGVGGSRRGVALGVGSDAGPGLLVGPDNGLLPPAADALGGVVAAVVLPRPTQEGTAPGPAGPSATFDGRDVFAPAVAAWCRGAPLDDLGEPADPAGLVRLPPPVQEIGVRPGGGAYLRSEVTWIDRFGNVQLATGAADVPELVLPAAAADSSMARRREALLAIPRAEGPRHRVQLVRTFGDIDEGRLGLLVDANGRLALACRQASAADVLGARPGDHVVVEW